MQNEIEREVLSLNTNVDPLLQHQLQRHEEEIVVDGPRMSVDVDPIQVSPVVDVAMSGETTIPQLQLRQETISNQIEETGPITATTDSIDAETTDKDNEPTVATTPNTEMAPPPPVPAGNGTRQRRESKGGKNSQLPFWMRSDRWPSIGTPSLRQANGVTAPQRVAVAGLAGAGTITTSKLEDNSPVRSTESTFASLLQPILALFPPQPPPTSLLPTIDLHDPIEPKPPMTNVMTNTMTNNECAQPSKVPATNDETVNTDTDTKIDTNISNTSEPFVIHRPAILKPLLPRTAARLAYTFDWRIDVFGDSPTEVKGQRTKYPKPVLPPIPPSEPLEFSLDDGLHPSSSHRHSTSHPYPYPTTTNSQPRRSPSTSSLKHSSSRKERSKGSLLMMSRAMENIRRGVIGGAGRGRGGRARSASILTSSSSCLSNVSLPSFVSGMSGSDDHHHDREHELVTPFGSEVAIDERLLFFAMQREAAEIEVEVGEGYSAEDVEDVPIRRYVDSRSLEAHEHVQDSPTAPLREGMHKLGLVTPPLASTRAAFIPYSEPVKRTRGRFEEEEEPEGNEEVGRMDGERESYTTGMTPFTPLTPRSVPSDESDDDEDD
ncbi:hypothetical protein FRC14_001705 [Serendipita sp. 396]|nr:hypothetical protein FRC14_001705 [Serendipita sp. 396]KAG8772280.1 hypothetical protein FRC15_002860 [Serendipita sp. 397]KAG8791634.1 hypothetical protein FRC16_000345 [Serendipita sp. 398]KAG8847257.1 hypothetical protein FRC20_002793 [Serendipita sp. 405]